MKQQEDAKEELSLRGEDHTEPISARQQTTHSAEYNDFFKAVGTDIKLKGNLLQILRDTANIELSEGQSKNIFQITVTNHTVDYQALCFSVEIFGFHLNITVFNFRGKSSTHAFENISTTRASIYKNSSIKNIVIKCISLKSKCFEDELSVVVKEFSLLKIASLLGIGPKMKSIFGFELVVYDDCVQFCMEECDLVDSITELQSLKLISKLQKLHALQIVHLDIKPQNICFSPSLNELVFIDFGFSEVLTEKIGQLSKTSSFVGSLGYCGAEMMNCYHTQSTIMLDLYYNDVCSLQKSFSELIEANPNGNPEFNDLGLNQHGYFNHDNQIILQKINKTYQLLFIKFSLFKCVDFFKDSQLKLCLHKFKQEIILFSKFLPFSHYLQAILHYYSINYGDEQSLRSYSQRREVQLHKITHYGHPLVTADIEFFQRYTAFIKGTTFKKTSLNIYEVKSTAQINLRDLVLSQAQVQQIRQDIYFDKFVTFTSFTSGASTLAEKIEACKIMVKVCSLEVGVDGSQMKLLVVCMKYLLDHFISTVPKNCSETIPILLCNLIILDELPPDQMSNYLKSILTIKLESPLQFILLLFRCSTLPTWIRAKLTSKYRYYDVYNMLQEMILIKFGELSLNTSDKDYKLAKILYKTLFCFFQKTFSVSSEYIFECRDYVNKMIEVPTRIKGEMMIFFYANMMRLGFKNHQSDEVRSFMQLIIEWENRISPKQRKFEYYHFIIFQYLGLSCNNQAIVNLIDNLKLCIGFPEAVEKLTIYNQYLYKKYSLVRLKDIEFYRSILSRLQEESVEKEGVLLFFITSLIIQEEDDRIHQSAELRAIMDNIVELLRIKFPLQKESTIRDLNQNYIGNIFQMGFYFCLIIRRSHRQNENCNRYLLFIKEYLEETLSFIECLFCKQRAYIFIILTEAFILKCMNKTQEISKLYKLMLHKNSFRSLPTSYVLIISEKLRMMSKNLQSEQEIEILLKWIKQNNIWFDFFTMLAKSKSTFILILNYVIKKQQYDQYFQIHSIFLSFLPLCSAKRYVLAYTRSLLISLENIQQHRNLLLESYKKSQALKMKHNPYYIILAVSLLADWPAADSNRQKEIKFICQGLEFVSNMTKMFVKNILLQFLIREQKVAMERIYKKSDRYQNIFKRYVKYGPQAMNFRDFKYSFCEFSKIKSIRSAAKKKNLIRCLKQYYNNLNLRESFFQSEGKDYSLFR